MFSIVRKVPQVSKVVGHSKYRYSEKEIFSIKDICAKALIDKLEENKVKRYFRDILEREAFSNIQCIILECIY